MSLSYRSRNDRFNKTIDTQKKYLGVFKVDIVDGSTVNDDGGFIFVHFRGLNLPARPLHQIGSRYALPTKEWLAKYGKQVHFLVLFEEGNINQCFFVGWCFKENAAKAAYADIENYVNFRSIEFEEVIKDEKDNGVYSFSHPATKQLIQLSARKGVLWKIVGLWIEIKEKAYVKAKSVKVDSPEIDLGEDASEPAVKGNTLNSNLTEQLKLSANMMKTLGTTFTELATQASLNPATSALASGLTKAGASLLEQSASMIKLIDGLKNQLNPKVKV